MPWKNIAALDRRTVKLIYEYLDVRVTLGLYTVHLEQLMHILENWTEYEKERRAGSMNTLARTSIRAYEYAWKYFDTGDCT
jgi:hypothetical protein